MGDVLSFSGLFARVDGHQNDANRSGVLILGFNKYYICENCFYSKSNMRVFQNFVTRAMEIHRQVGD